MKILIIPDIHLKPWLFDRAEDILKGGGAGRAVCLMDIPDDWDMGFQVDRYRESFDRAIDFARAFPDTLWCYGNHDVSYPWGRLESGYSPYAEKTVMTKLEELRDAVRNPSGMAFVQRIDNILFSHGGLTEDFVRTLDAGLPEADIEDVLSAVNSASADQLWDDESPLWCRPQYSEPESFRKETYTQVVGHTPVRYIFEQNGFISTDVFSTYRDGKQIGESAMVVIDSLSREYEKVSVAM